MACAPTIDTFQAADGTIDVVTKYNLLMQTTMSEDSLYTRAKETYYELFEKYSVGDPEKAKIVVENITLLTQKMSDTAMQGAIAWAKEERDGPYTLAKVKAETENTLAEFEKITAEICLITKQTDAQCASIMSTTAASVRENGRALSYEADGCTVATLEDKGLKAEQTRQVEAATYQIHADTYRKSGIVQVGSDGGDGLTKGLSGPVTAISGGYTNQQTLNAERQRQAYEDSKINHMLNAVGVVTGQMLSAEVDPDTEIIAYMKSGMAKLLSPNSGTPTPFGGA